MKHVPTLLTMFVFILTAPALAHDADHHERGEITDAPKGYVLKPGEGEDPVGDGLDFIKASPSTGTQGTVFVEARERPGSTSGVHVHLVADEFFYVLGGRGRILLGEEETEITTGDMIFVPVGIDHRVTSSQDDPLHIIFILDRPGLDEQFRLEAKSLDRTKLTLEEFNKITRKYGTVYKSFD